MKQHAVGKENLTDADAVYYKSLYDQLRVRMGNSIKQSGSGSEARALKEVKKLEEKVRDLEQRGSGAKTEGREKIRALYEAVTSIHVKVGEADEAQFVCTSRNETKKRVSRFKLERSDPNLIKFTPTANAELFPEHLQQSIEIAASHCPLLLTDLLGAQQQD